MSERQIPQAPAGLGDAGQGLWKAILMDLDEGWSLDARELHLLERACRCADELALLEAAVDADGPITQGSRDQLRVHPALAEARQLRVVQLRLLASLELADPDSGERTATVASMHGRHAARARWSRQARMREQRASG